MHINDLDQTISKLHDVILERYGIDAKDKNLKFIQMVKLQEEVGELAEELLKMNQLQRSEKGAHDRTELKKEFADVLVSVLLLAKSLDISFKEILDSKLGFLVEKYLEK